MRSECHRLVILLPSLSDEAAVQVLDVLYDFLHAFESRYGDQIHRYYEDRSCHNIVRSDPSPRADEPPF